MYVMDPAGVWAVWHGMHQRKARNGDDCAGAITGTRALVRLSSISD
jgi:hypothetical protein